MRDLVQEVGPHLLRIVRRVEEVQCGALDRSPTRLTRRIMEHTTVSMVRTVPVRHPKARHQRLVRRRVSLSRRLTVVVDQRTHTLEVLVLPRPDLVPELRRSLSHRPFTRRESVRGLDCQPADLRRVVPQRLSERNATVARNPLLCLVHDRRDLTRDTLRRPRRRRPTLDLALRQVHERVQHLNVELVSGRPLAEHLEQRLPRVPDLIVRHCSHNNGRGEDLAPRLRDRLPGSIPAIEDDLEQALSDTDRSEER